MTSAVLLTYNKCDFGIIVHRNREKECVEVRVSKVKFRHLGKVGIAHFKYNLNNGRYTPFVEGRNHNGTIPTTSLPTSSRSRQTQRQPPCSILRTTMMATHSLPIVQTKKNVRSNITKEQQINSVSE